MSFRTLSGALLSLALCGAPAAAEPVTLQFTGEIVDISAGLNGAFTSGDLATWLVSYETEQTPDRPTPEIAIYGPRAFSQFSGTFGAYGVDIDPTHRQQWAMTRDGEDGFHAGWAVNYYGTAGYSMIGAPIGTLTPWSFISDVILSLPSNGLPTSGAAMGPGTFALYYRDNARDEVHYVEGRITGVQKIPEPGTAALVGIGIAFAYIYRRRRRPF
ncbi:MAG TPA: PEP-CTERM sorting domain-containing protein [Vicinamibacterales bacterium]